MILQTRLLCTLSLFYLLEMISTRETPVYRTVHLGDLYDNPFWEPVNKRWSAPTSGLITRVAVHLGSNSVFVALNNSVIRLSASRLEKLDEVSWSLPREHSETCEKKPVNGLVDCNSYAVSLLLPVEGIFSMLTLNVFRTGLFTCISNGRTCECSLRQVADLRAPPKVHWKGSRYCPIDPLSTVAVTYASNRNLYVAGKFDEDHMIIPTIVRISERPPEGNPSSTMHFARFPSRNKWIFQDERTEFIHSFEFHDAVYFLFREPAEELIDGCKKLAIISRVGRLCLVDDSSQSGRLQTFVKATIVCPGPDETSSESLLVHTLMQSVHLDKSSKTLFAVFTTSSAMPASSVLCEYRLTEVEKAFEGPFHLFRSEHTKYDNPIRCLNSDGTKNLDTDLPLNSRLMHNVIHPRTGQSILMKEGVLWRHVSVDWVPQTPKSDNNLIVFTMDSEEVLTKWHLFKSEACVIEQIHMHRVPELGRMRDKTIHMQLIRNQSKPILYIATTATVYRLPVARCSRLGHNERVCDLLHDPYCAWNRHTHQCQELLDTQEPGKQLIRYEMCPVELQEQPDVVVDGQWGAWGPWSPCQMSANRSLHARWLVASTSRRVLKNWEATEPLIVNSCHCRYRYCSSPYRFGIGSKACPGEEAIQITNCSIDGTWTAWSSWSGCEPSCMTQRQRDKLPHFIHHELSSIGENSHPIRTRQRWCTNPSPLGEFGTKCPGAGKESDSCPKLNISCPVKPVSLSTWSTWSEWNLCSTACNGGVQLRWRKCGLIDNVKQFQPIALKTSMINDLLNQDNSDECLGEAYESRACNTHNCPITKVTSSWTEWYIIDGDHQKGTQERRYRVECVATVPEVDKLQASIQLQNANCRVDTTGNVVCQDINPKQPTETRNTVRTNQTEHGWSPWTSCSRPCGGGVRNRWRLRGSLSDRSFVLDVQGSEKEEEVCNPHPCPGRWSCWTAWSKCTHPPCSIQRGEQRRFRTCLVSSSLHLADGQEPTVDQCDGGEEYSVHSRPCETTFEDLQCQPHKFDLRKRTIPDEMEAHVDPNLKTSTPWAEWSECLPVEGLAYEVRIRAREQCDGCELVQAKRCDTHETVSVDEILKQAPLLRGAKQAGQDIEEFSQFGWGHAVAAGVCGAFLGIIVVLIPYWMYVKKRKRAQKPDRQKQRFTGSRKTNKHKPQLERYTPYIWFADTSRSEKVAVKQMLLQRKRPNSPAVDMSLPTVRTRAGSMKITENLGDSPSTIQTKSSLARADPYRNASLTRIQALHNDHRNVMKNRNASPLSVNEPTTQCEPMLTEKTGTNPGFVDSSPARHHYGHVVNASPTSSYDSKKDTVDTMNKYASPSNTRVPPMRSSSPGNNEIIYASAQDS